MVFWRFRYLRFTIDNRSTFLSQANALLRKNLTFQVPPYRNSCTFDKFHTRRNIGANVRLICIPIAICLLLAIVQHVSDTIMAALPPKCECTCVDTIGDGKCDKVPACQETSIDPRCPIPNPREWPPTLEVPFNAFRAVRSSDPLFIDLPNESCRLKDSCPATSLFTGNNQSLGLSLAKNMMATSFHLNSSDVMGSLGHNVLATNTELGEDNYNDPAFNPPYIIYNLQRECTSDIESPYTFSLGNEAMEVSCIKGLNLWRNSSLEIKDMLFKGYHLGGSDGTENNEFVAAYDFMDSNYNNLNANIWYKSTGRSNVDRPALLPRVPRLVNLVSNAYLQILKGPKTKILFEFFKEMPKALTLTNPDITSQMGPLFFTWIILQLFPVVLQSLVYEKQQKLRIMMKMHGLGDAPYWAISYAYFITISIIYMLCFAIFGSLIGLKFFSNNGFTIQVAFYFIYLNLQVAFAFLVATMFSEVKTAIVFGHITVFASGLVGMFVFEELILDLTFSRTWVLIMELYPGFSLYRGLYEFSMSAVEGAANGSGGMQWEDSSENGMLQLLLVMIVEWFVIMFVAYQIDQAISFGKCFNFLRKKRAPTRKPSLQGNSSDVVVGLDSEKPGVIEEREKVDQIVLEPGTINSYAVVSDNLEKVYPGRDGNPKKFAVQGLSLALPRGECFGMLGPNGAGKTSFISMMIGLTKPTGGAAYVEGLDIQTDMNEIYTSMGVCPQHDLLWDTLTGREHLLFYGRLKNLKDTALTEAVEESLKNLNLFHGGVADKQSRKYSGGMKRRLSVAISLIGDPKVVYMDEPSTGLDPASRNSLWNVVKEAKRDRAIILTTHSMEEAEALCDRLGIFVDGNFHCIGNSNELKAIYGGTYVFTMTTLLINEVDIEKMVQSLSPNSKKIYQLAGTQKFELPKNEVKIADVFKGVEDAKRRFTVFAWGLADTTLEDVFIKVAQSAQAFNTLS
ncbi:hypothetical protein ACFE04_001977 [Oxalis oulophora]